MNARTLQVMTVAALAIAGAAWYSTRSGEPTEASVGASAGSELFPGLAQKTGEVSSIKLQSKGQTFTLEKKDGTWGAADKGGYPVNFDKVKDVVSKLAYFKILEKKTDRPELLGKLDLEEPDKLDSKSTRVTLADASGTVLADVLIGKNASGGGPGISSLYVRRPGENQAYEVGGTLYVDGTPTNWLDKQVVKLERARVHRVETAHTDGSKLVITKASPDDKNYTVADLAEGQELKWAGVADGIAGALEYLNFDDVEPAGRIDFNDPKATTTTMQTFDGMLVTVKVLEQDSKFYGQFSAKADPAARVEVTKFEPPPPVGPQPGEAPADPNAPPPEPAAPVETKSVPGKSAEEIATEAAALQERLSKWTFVLPGYAATNFTKKQSDMIKEPEPPPLLPGLDPNATPPQDGAIPPVKDPADPTNDGNAQDPAPTTGGGGGR